MPGLGGTSDSGITFPLSWALIMKTPLEVRLIRSVFTTPFSLRASLNRKPLVASPLQYGLPVSGLVPAGRLTVSDDGVPPFARTVSVAPPMVGSPTIVSGLGFSLALTVTFRLSGVLGFFTANRLPRMVWSAASTGTTPASTSAATASAPRKRIWLPPSDDTT